MSVTYKKKLKTLVVTLLDGTTYNLADTAAVPAASDAFAQWQSGHGAYIESNGTKYWIPATAISTISVTISDSDDITVEDPCTEEGGE